MSTQLDDYIKEFKARIGRIGPPNEADLNEHINEGLRLIPVEYQKIGKKLMRIGSGIDPWNYTIIQEEFKSEFGLPVWYTVYLVSYRQKQLIEANNPNEK